MIRPNTISSVTGWCISISNRKDYNPTKGKQLTWKQILVLRIKKHTVNKRSAAKLNFLRT